MTNPRNLVKQALEFKRPARIPRQLWHLPWAKANHAKDLEKILRDFPSDIKTAPGFQTQMPKITGDPYAKGLYIDEWGCMFENIHDGIIGEVREPLIKEWQDIEKVRVPEELLSITSEKINAFCRASDTFVLAGCCPRPFEQLQFMRKTDLLYMDLVDRPPGLNALIQKLHGFYTRQMELWAATNIDGFQFMDDWGSQQSLLIDPAMWRDIFKPLYKTYVDIAHAHKKYIFMHSDGYILDILPDLIEIGVDAVNSQIFCMGVDNLKQFRGRITFWGEIDRQHVLPSGTTREVEKAVTSVYKGLYADGGIIAQCEFGPGAKPENVYTVFKTWQEIHVA